jgi:hypothetical protein
MAILPSTPHSQASYGGFLNAVEKCPSPTDAFNSRERERVTLSFNSKNLFTFLSEPEFSECLEFTELFKEFPSTKRFT